MAMSPAVTADSLRYYLTEDPVAARPEEWEISLHTGDPGADGTGNEAAYSGYARQAIGFEEDDSDPEAPAAFNDGEITFPANTVEFVVTHIVVWGDATPLVIQALADSKTIPADAPAVLAVGELTIGGRN